VADTELIRTSPLPPATIVDYLFHRHLTISLSTFQSVTTTVIQVIAFVLAYSLSLFKNTSYYDLKTFRKKLLQINIWQNEVTFKIIFINVYLNIRPCFGLSRHVLKAPRRRGIHYQHFFPHFHTVVTTPHFLFASG
jgi:hypothetical protein